MTRFAVVLTDRRCVALIFWAMPFPGPRRFRIEIPSSCRKGSAMSLACRFALSLAIIGVVGRGRDSDRSRPPGIGGSPSQAPRRRQLPHVFRRAIDDPGTRCPFPVSDRRPRPRPDVRIRKSEMIGRFVRKFGYGSPCTENMNSSRGDDLRVAPDSSHPNHSPQMLRTTSKPVGS